MNMSLRSNPVFWLMWLLPAATVLAGFATLAIAMHGADRALPEAYHWEGERLDQDFARQRRAAELGVEVSLQIAGGKCVATLRGDPGDPAALDLLLTHGSDAGLDQRVRLRRAARGVYGGACDVTPARWRIAIDASSADWSLRARHALGADRTARVTLRARDPGPSG
jgi:uncharacterized protein